MLLQKILYPKVSIFIYIHNIYVLKIFLKFCAVKLILLKKNIELKKITFKKNYNCNNTKEQKKND